MQMPCASTEPRPRGRGTRGRGHSRIRRRGGFNGAPTSRSGNAPRLHEILDDLQGLQRSPDLAVGERPNATSLLPRSGSFNGAPTSRSGNDGPRSAPGTQGAGFNGAPTSGSGNGPASRARTTNEARFNGAPTSRSGNVAPLPQPRDRLEVASTEPRPRGRGTLTAITRGDTEWRLQRSPDLAVGEREPDVKWEWMLCQLQRSPDLAVGERTWHRRRGGGEPSFNGAPTSRSGNA